MPESEPKPKPATPDLFAGQDPFQPAPTGKFEPESKPKAESRPIQKPAVPKTASGMMLPKSDSGPAGSPGPPSAPKPSFPSPPSPPTPGLPKPPQPPQPPQAPAKPSPSVTSPEKLPEDGKISPPFSPPVKDPVKPFEPSKPSENLLPGQKKGEEVGAPQRENQILRTPKSESDIPPMTSLPSHTGKLSQPQPAAKPAIVKKPDAKAQPAPDTRRTSTGTLKKESLRLKALPSGNFKPMAMAAGSQSKPAPKPVPPSSPASEPEFKSPAIPLIKSKDKPAEPAPPKPPVASKTTPALATGKPKEPAKPPVAPSQAKSTTEASKLKPQPALKAEAKAKAAAVAGESPSAPASQRKKPKVVLPPRREEREKKSPLLLLIPLGILLLAGIAFAFYWSQRQTSVEVTVESGDMTLRSEAIVVMNFAGKLQMLRDDLFRRRAPIEEEIDRIKANLSAALADLAGREQRKKLLDDMLDQYKAEIPQFLSESQQALNSLWEDQSVALAKEYDEFKESLHQEIMTRAEELGVDYQRNTEIDAIAVAVNAFRLALYGVPKEVDVSEQRAWAEGLLQRWDAYEKEWRSRQTEIKEQALKIKKEPLPKIADTRKRIDNLEREIDAVEIDLQSLRDEVARHEQNLQEATQRLAAVDDPFFLELQAIPKEFEVARFPVDNNGVIRMPQLNEREDLSQGTHFLLVRAVKDDMEYWAVDEFEVLPYQSVKSSIQSDQFVPLRQILEEGTFMKP